MLVILVKVMKIRNKKKRETVALGLRGEISEPTVKSATGPR